jgi:hypothetical protein
MKENSVTIEKIQNILEQFQTSIETKVENEKLFLRNGHWDNIKDKLTPLELIQNKKKLRQYPQNSNTHYVHMQNNFYLNITPQQMFPQNMPIDPMLAQQMMFQQYGMYGNQFNNPYAAFQQPPQNNNLNSQENQQI